MDSESGTRDEAQRDQSARHTRNSSRCFGLLAAKSGSGALRRLAGALFGESYVNKPQQRRAAHGLHSI